MGKYATKSKAFIAWTNSLELVYFPFRKMLVISEFFIGVAYTLRHNAMWYCHIRLFLFIIFTSYVIRGNWRATRSHRYSGWPPRAPSDFPSFQCGCTSIAEVIGWWWGKSSGCDHPQQGRPSVRDHQIWLGVVSATLDGSYLVVSATPRGD
jgi:hypothetical protein